MAPSADTTAVADQMKANGWLMFIVLSLLILMFFWLSITYIFGAVVTTLAFVEDTTSPEFAATPSDSDTDAHTLPPYSDDPTPKPPGVPAVTPADDVPISPPLTASLGRTLKHLRSRAGFLSLYRGFHIALLVSILNGALTQTAAHLFGRSVIAAALVGIAVNVLLARVYLLWTHVVISEPSPKRFWRRFAGRRAGRKILLPTLAWSLANAVLSTPLAVVVTKWLVPAYKKYTTIDPDHPKNQHVSIATLVGMGLCVGVVLLATFALSMPVQMIFVRCQAALLPEDETPIVPFDRTFGGRVAPEIEGGDGKLSIRDAWRSCSRQDWRRVALVYLKIAGLHLVYYVAFALHVAVICIALSKTNGKQ